MKKLFYPLVMAIALVATACTNTKDDVIDNNPTDKTPISFVGENSTTPITRGGFEGSTDTHTEVAMHIRSTYGTDVRETRTLAKAAHVAKGSSASSTISQDAAYIRYWDDAHGRNSKLSVFAIAVPGKSTLSLESKLPEAGTASAPWTTAAVSESVDWSVSTTQDADKIDNEDLTYSRNIQGEDALKFNLTTSDPNGPGKFEEGRIVFTHALSRITIYLNKDLNKGFTASSPFKFKDDENVSIAGVPTSGTLNLEKGEWTPSTTSTGITKMSCTKKDDGNYELLAQVVPGFKINDGDKINKVLSFTIDGNLYTVSHDDLFDVLDGKTGVTSESGVITMEQGKNYKLTINVGKTNVTNISATLEAWKEVNGEKDLNNSREPVTVYKGAGGENKKFDLYRAVVGSADGSWNGNYSGPATISEEGGVLKTNWYYENDNSYYHFRTVKENTKIKGNDKDDVVDYFDILSGAKDDAHDYRWGAPLKEGTTSPITYNTTNGYGGVINSAIRSTSSSLNFTEFHMMSNIYVVLRTPTTGGTVALEDANQKQCEVKLTNFYADGHVNMGNGLITIPTGISLSDDDFTPAEKGLTVEGTSPDPTYNVTKAFTYAVVPQQLGTIGLTITTPDGNKYTIKDLSTIKVGGATIDFWNPNHKYTYTFTLTKTGINNITCTVQGWTEVTADNTNVTLE